MLRLIMAPSNAVCDLLEIEDEQERGMVRMLVNVLIWTTISATGFFVGWMIVVG
jgi:hypothetical protein